MNLNGVKIEQDLKFSPDGQLMERPSCGTPGCKGFGFALIGNKFYCGDCTMKWSNARAKYIQENQNNIDNMIKGERP